MTAPKGPLELVREEIMRRLGPEIDARFEQLTPILIKALNRDQPLETVPDPPAVAPATAAKRTTVQGVVALVLAGVLGFAADAVSDENFQIFDLSDWKGLGSGAVVAGIMALLAFGQRKIGR
ncbi:hypothetical protein [Rhodococcoides fascians]|uniref:hypothetical protein n=1 Tax=Rhodococcoides fascians TaxID=1828 RepID=UPI00055C0F4C|nr:MULTISPECIES: hypothetical protein [Rhodococcus]OZF05570.1 hypothetical protein CH301_04055 [Rhodococcus sp. 15-1189-1-1a]OZF20354.1 hypothetical protein CH299_04600 [Rhodococcus sp. 14-2686-1-2]